jgi:hypothetical protein
MRVPQTVFSTSKGEKAMSTEPATTPVEAEVSEITASAQEGVGASRVGLLGIIFITAYLMVFSIFLLYGLVQLWPRPAQAGEAAVAVPLVTLLLWTFPVADEVRLIVIVAMAGALGSLVHALRSVYWYIGHRELVWSWMIKYILLPFVGSTLGLVFYFVIRGGFFSPQATVQQTSPFSFVALASLVGLFSEQAVLKLKDVAETLLTQPKPGADARPQEPGTSSKPPKG